eukprot:3072764-Pleurochrysis_carterae.AAC.1
MRCLKLEKRGAETALGRQRGLFRAAIEVESREDAGSARKTEGAGKRESAHSMMPERTTARAGQPWITSARKTSAATGGLQGGARRARNEVAAKELGPTSSRRGKTDRRRSISIRRVGSFWSESFNSADGEGGKGRINRGRGEAWHAAWGENNAQARRHDEETKGRRGGA